MRSAEEVRAAFAGLPELVTNRQIADATGQNLQSVRTNWPRRPDYPAPVGEGKAQRRPREAVLRWFEEQFANPGERQGPRDLTPRAREAAPLNLSLTGAQLAEVLGVNGSLVRYYAATYGPDSSAPFPPADEQGRRPWQQVRRWILRQRGEDPGDAAEEAQDLLLASTRGGTDLADAIRELSRQLGVSADTAHRILTANAGHRLGSTALAAATGVSTELLAYYARTFGPDRRDPFPPADEHHTRVTADVIAWLTRYHAQRAVAKPTAGR